MRSFTVMAMLAAFMLCWSGGLNGLRAEDSKQTVTGTVEAASPCGTVLKVTRAITPCGSQTETLTLQANSDEMKKQVQGLKKGSTVTVTCSPCPRSKRLIISGIKQAEGSEKSCPK